MSFLTLEAAGLSRRLWSIRTLRGAYTRTQRTSPEQTVVDTGPYRYVRHPGCLGSLLTGTGYAVSSGRAPAVGVVVASMATAYRHRILAEEALLAVDLPGYADYRTRTKRLIPFLW